MYDYAAKMNKNLKIIAVNFRKFLWTPCLYGAKLFVNIIHLYLYIALLETYIG